MKKLNLFYKISLILAFAVAFSACTEEEDLSQYDQYNLRDLTVADYVANNAITQSGKYNTLLAAVEKAGLVDALNGGDITLFAPSDAAFEAAGIDIRDVDAATLAEILTYHVVGSVVEFDGLSGQISTVQGDAFTFDGSKINGLASIVDADVSVSNGVVHEIDQVLMPPTGNIVDKVGEFVSAATPEFTLLQAAVVKAGLADVLSGSTRYTVFAPTDAAFEAAGIDQAFIDAATAEELADVLLFHVVAGDIFSSGIASGRTETAAGSLETTKGIDIEVGDPVTIEGAEVTTTDVLASNGVIHVVDAVIFPKQTVAEALNNSNPNFVAYYQTFRFFEILDKSGIEYGLNDEVILYVPSNWAVDTYLDDLGTDVASLTQQECIDIVNFHTFDKLSSQLSELYETNAQGDEFLYTSNSDGNFLNIQYDVFGFSTIDALWVADLRGFGLGFRAYSSFSDQEFYNGNVTTITSVLTPLPTNTIVDELVADGNYTALVAAALKTGLAETLANDNYTVFAPNDAAFDDIGFDAATIDALDETDDAETIALIEAILLNHVIADVLPGTSIFDAGTVTTVGGKSFELEVDSNDNVVIADNTVDESDNVVVGTTDVLTQNGVIHGELSKVLN